VIQQDQIVGLGLGEVQRLVREIVTEMSSLAALIRVRKGGRIRSIPG
jgi:hypothetical protein